MHDTEEGRSAKRILEALELGGSSLADMAIASEDIDPVTAGRAELLQRRTETLTLARTATLRAERTTPFVRDWPTWASDSRSRSA